MAFASFLVTATVRKVQLQVGIIEFTQNLGLDAAGLSTGFVYCVRFQPSSAEPC